MPIGQSLTETPGKMEYLKITRLDSAQETSLDLKIFNEETT